MGEEADADWQAGLIECGEETVMPKMTKLRVQAQYLQPGDIVGSGDTIEYVVRNGVTIPSNKVEIGLKGKGFRFWGKYTMINVERAE